MKKLLSHPSPDIIHVYASVLDAKGIPTFFKNENTLSVAPYLAAAAGYPELWVVNDEDYERAMELLRTTQSEEIPD